MSVKGLVARCVAKKAFATRAEAQAEVHKLGGWAREYHCGCCARWHVGRRWPKGHRREVQG